MAILADFARQRLATWGRRKRKKRETHSFCRNDASASVWTRIQSSSRRRPRFSRRRCSSSCSRVSASSEALARSTRSGNSLRWVTTKNGIHNFQVTPTGELVQLLFLLGDGGQQRTSTDPIDGRYLRRRFRVERGGKQRKQTKIRPVIVCHSRNTAPSDRNRSR